MRKSVLTICALSFVFSACGGSGGGSNTAGPKGLNYPTPDGRYLVGVTIETNKPSVKNEVNKWSIAPDLPSGLTFSKKNGRISGTPDALAVRQSYTVTAKGPGGKTSASLFIAVDQPPRFAFSANPANDTLSTYIVDAQTGGLQFHGFRSHASPQSTPQDIVFHPDGAWAFVVNNGVEKVNSTITVYAVDEGSGELTATDEVATGIQPRRLALSSDGSNAYVIAHESNRVHSYAFDAATGTLSALSDQLTNTGPERIAVDPLGRFVYVTHGPSADVTIFHVDPVTGEVGPFVDGINYWGFVPTDIVVDPTGAFAYISFEGTDTILTYSIQPGSGALWTTLEMPAQGLPRDLAIPPYGGALYVANEDLDTVSIYTLDPANGTPQLVENVAVGDAPAHIAFDDSGTYAYVLNAGSNDVSVFRVDELTGALTAAGTVRTRADAATFTVYGGPRPAQPKAEYLYVLNQESDGVSSFTIDGTLGSLSANGSEILTGDEPESVAVDPRGRYLFVANAGTDDLSIFSISPGSGQLVQNLANEAVSSAPRGVAVDPSGSYLFVTLDSNEVVSFAIQAGGALSEVDRAATGATPTAVSVDPTGQFVYVSNATTVSAYLLSDGQFAAGPVDAPAPGGAGPLRFSPSGERAYAALNGSLLVSPYAIDPTSGELTIDGAGAAATQTRPNAVEIHPNGRFAFAAAPGGASETGSVERFGADSATGALTPLGTSAAGLSPWDLRLDPMGRFLYAVNEDGDDLSVFRVDAETGGLSELAQVSAGLAPRALVFTTRVD